MRQTELKRSTPLDRGQRLKQRKTFQASPEQRAKVRGLPCIVTGEEPADPAHVLSRAMGGCDHPDCVVPLTRRIHQLYDEDSFDLLPYLIPGYIPELQHALGHRKNLVGLLQFVTNDRWMPIKEPA